MPVTCRYLDWDTQFFGIRVARINESSLSSTDFPTALDWCRRERIRCLYLLASASDAATSRGAEDNGFHLADIRVTLNKPLNGIVSSGGESTREHIRPARESDIAALVQIARVSHTDSRFYYDPGFPRERCDALYGVWIENSFRGDPQTVVVFTAERDGKPAGYITCHIEEDTGRIGLIGVAAWARGEGLGGQLVDQSLRYFQTLGLKRATVVTQGRNTTAQRMYEKNGFLIHSVELWYHRWFDDPRHKQKYERHSHSV